MNRRNTGSEELFENREDPSPAQIKEACREIRAEWSENTRRNRIAQRPASWTVPRTQGVSVLEFTRRSIAEW